MAKRQYKHRYMITRTLSTTSADIAFYDASEKIIKTQHVILSGRYTETQFIKHAAAICGGNVLEISNKVTETKLYALSVEEFLAHATVIE